MPPRSALTFFLIAGLICCCATGAYCSSPKGLPLPPALSVRAVPSPLLDPAEILVIPHHGEGRAEAARRIIGLGAEPGGPVGSAGPSAGKAILLSAVAPGAGHIYSGYKRGYLYLGMEAVAWISYLVLREDGNRRAEQAEEYAGDPFDPASNWSFGRYVSEGYCNASGGSEADSTLRARWADDRATFYDLIERDRSYDCGWLGSEEWSEFRGMRSNSDDLLKWARYAGAAVILNHAIAVLDMARLTREFEIPGGADVRFDVKPSLPHPSGTIRIKKEF